MKLLEMQNAIIEILNSMNGFKSGWDTTEERINELSDMSEDIFWNTAQRNKETKIWKKLRFINKIYRAIKPNIWLSKILEREKRQTGTEQYLKYPELNIFHQINAVQWILCKIKDNKRDIHQNASRTSWWAFNPCQRSHCRGVFNLWGFGKIS